MNNGIAFILTLAFVVAASAASPAAPQLRPGEVTKPSVWVENRGRDQAIPTTIEGMNEAAKPLRIEVIGVPAVTLGPSTIVQARAVRQAWEHQLLTVPAGQDLAAALARIDAGNWEAVGFQATPNGTAVLLKRPR